jgi:hypothetical protein
MIRLLSLLLRRRRYVIVDEAAHARLCELAVVGEAIAVVEAEEARWLNLDAEPGDG